MSGRRDSRHSTRPWPLYVLALATAGVIAVGIIELGPPSASSARTSSQTVTVGQGVVQMSVTGTGNVEPATDDDVDFQTGGTLAHVYVSLGQHLNKGQLIATLDHTPAQITLDEADLALTNAQSALASAEAETPGTVASTSTSSPSANDNSEVADTNDSDTQENTTMMRAGTVTGPTSTATFTTPASTTPASTTPPAKTTPASTTPASTTPASTTPASTTPASTTPAREPSASRTPSSSSSSKRAKPSSSSNGSSGTSSASSHSTGTVLTAAEIAATVAQDNLTVAQDAVTRNNDRKTFYATWLYAPVSGTIASLSSLAPGDTVSAGTTSNVASSASSTSSSSSSSTGAAGGLGGFASTASDASDSGSSGSSSSSPFAEIVNTRALTMSVPLSESDISQVQNGQPATISLDALPSVELAAHVSAISPTATTSGGVVSYNVTLTIDQANSQVKPGMSASASIIVKQASGVTIPVDALTGTSSLASVNLKKGSTTVPTEVVVGLRGTSNAQIVSGLSPGQQIVVKTTLPALNTSVSSGSSSTSSGTLGGGAGLGGATAAGGAGGFAGRGGGGGGGFAARLGG